MKFNDVQSSIEFCRKQQLAGHVLWYSRGVLDVYAKEFTSFYDVAKTGRAPNPFKPFDWRPLPIVATKSGDAWRATVKTPGKYQVIVRTGDAWHTAQSTFIMNAGEQTIPGTGDAVELIVDRRP